MKIITIGDIHGKDFWEAVNPDEYDFIVFVGDYTDSFDRRNVEIKVNLLKIIELYYKYPDKVKLLLGNHDLPYFWGKPDPGLSGHRPVAIWDLHIIFRDNRKLFQAAFQIDNYIWTHAGIHRGWYNKYIPDAIKEYELTGNLAEQLNHLFEINFPPLFVISHYRGGSAREGGPFWADWREIYTKPLQGYHQIFGHTARTKGIRNYPLGKDTSVTCVDTGGKTEFYELTI